MGYGNIMLGRVDEPKTMKFVQRYNRWHKLKQRYRVVIFAQINCFAKRHMIFFIHRDISKQLRINYILIEQSCLLIIWHTH